MEGLFENGDRTNAINHIASSIRSTFLARAAGCVDRTIHTCFDTTHKQVFGKCLEKRGYQLQGLNMPPRGMGLTRGQREVRFCSYRPEAEPFLREARSIAAELLSAQTQPATGLKLGKGECTVRIVVPEEIGSIEHAGSFRRDDVSCHPRALAGALLGCAGGRDLLVFDIRISEHTMASVKGIADKCFGTNRSPPSYYLTQATGAVAAKIAKTKSGILKEGGRQYIRFEGPDVSAAEYQYLQSVKLLLLALALNRAQTSKHTAVHCCQHEAHPRVEDSDDDEGHFGSGDEEPVWFPPNRTVDPAADRLEKSIAALQRAQGSTVGLIPCLPATEFSGTPYQDMVVTMSDEQHEELLKQSLRAEGGSTQNAFYCGPNITGAPPPLDTKHPETWASAYGRHFCKVKKNVPLPNGEVLLVVHDKEELLHKKLGGHQLRVWNDLMTQHEKLFRDWLQQPLNAAVIKTEQKPHSMDQETYDAVRAEVNWDDEYGAREVMRAAVFCKSGENKAKARFITMPGTSQEDAKRHQAGCSAITQILEKFHTDQFGFRNFKGCSLTGKALKVARFIALTNDNCVSIGFDKGSNDATWTHRKWAKYEEYSMRMARILTDAYFDDNTPPMLDADGARARKIQWRGMYLTVAANINYMYLMSGVGPTSLSNRMGGDVSIGAGILQGYGEEAYQEWLQWSSGQDAEIVDEFEEVLFPHLNDGISVKENVSAGFAHINEGDDTCIKIPVRKGESNTDAVTHFTKSITTATQEVWEPAYVNGKHLDSHGGARSCVEITSMIVASVVEENAVRFAYVPKPVKRLDKMAWTLSAALRVIDTPAGKVGVSDTTYHRLNATRCLSMCTEMQYSLFVRYVVYRTAEFHLNKLRMLARDQRFGDRPNVDKPLYNDRTQEARQMPEATGLIGDSIETAFTSIGLVLARTDITSKQCLEANANAWALENPSVLKDGKLLREKLLQLDEVARGIEITEDFIQDPVQYLSMFELGPLEACFTNIVGRLSKAVELNEKQQLPLNVLKQKLIDSVSNGQKSANAQSQPGAPFSNGKGRGALGRSGKGGEATSSYQPGRAASSGAR